MRRIILNSLQSSMWHGTPAERAEVRNDVLLSAHAFGRAYEIIDLDAMLLERKEATCREYRDPFNGYRETVMARDGSMMQSMEYALEQVSQALAKPARAQASAIDGSVAVRNDDDRVVLTVVDPEGRSATVILSIAQAYMLSHNLEDTAQGLELSDSEGY
jgi:hypothetical protein